MQQLTYEVGLVGFFNQHLGETYLYVRYEHMTPLYGEPHAFPFGYNDPPDPLRDQLERAEATNRLLHDEIARLSNRK